MLVRAILTDKKPEEVPNVSRNSLSVMNFPLTFCCEMWEQFHSSLNLLAPAFFFQITFTYSAEVGSVKQASNELTCRKSIQ